MTMTTPDDLDPVEIPGRGTEQPQPGRGTVLICWYGARAIRDSRVLIVCTPEAIFSSTMGEWRRRTGARYDYDRGHRALYMVTPDEEGLLHLPAPLGNIPHYEVLEVPEGCTGPADGHLRWYPVYTLPAVIRRTRYRETLEPDVDVHAPYDIRIRRGVRLPCEGVEMDDPPSGPPDISRLFVNTIPAIDAAFVSFGRRYELRLKWHLLDHLLSFRPHAPDPALYGPEGDVTLRLPAEGRPFVPSYRGTLTQDELQRMLCAPPQRTSA